MVNVEFGGFRRPPCEDFSYDKNDVSYVSDSLVLHVFLFIALPPVNEHEFTSSYLESPILSSNQVKQI